jgi:hypothetical protein
MHILTLGDTLVEGEAGVLLAAKFEKSVVKTLKLRPMPQFSELLSQLIVINDNLNDIFNCVESTNYILVSVRN